MLDWLLTYLPWLWLGFVVVGSSLLGLLWGGVVVLRAADVRYDPQVCRSRSPVVDLRKALVRKHSWPLLALPLFVICAALFGVQLLWMSITTYTVISIMWFLTMPVRMVWGIAVSRRVFRELNSHPVRAGFWREVRQYYTLGLAMPLLPPEKVWFVGRLRWLNKLQKFRFLVQVYRFWGIFAAAACSLLWPVASAVVIFTHLNWIDAHSYLCPWWRFDRKLRPKERKTVQNVDAVARRARLAH